MVTPELIAFIKAQLKAGQTKEAITSVLLSNNWKIVDILNAFAEASRVVNPLPKLARPREINKKILKFFVYFLLALGTLLLIFYCYTGGNSVLFFRLKEEMISLPSGYEIVKLVKIFNLKERTFQTILENREKGKQIVISRRKGGEVSSCPSNQIELNAVKYCLYNIPYPQTPTRKNMHWSVGKLSFNLSTSDEEVSDQELINLASSFSNEAVKVQNNFVGRFENKLKNFASSLIAKGPFVFESIKKFQDTSLY